MLLVALIAAAGFVVLAKRRLRQLGMLAAVGATEQHVRLVTVVNGALVGLIAAVVGTAVGLAAWAAGLGRVEAAAGHRIGGLSAPVWLVGGRHAAGGGDGHGQRLVAGPGGGPHPGHARPLGPAAPAQAGPPLGTGRRRPGGGRARLPRTSPTRGRNPSSSWPACPPSSSGCCSAPPSPSRRSPGSPSACLSPGGWRCGTWPATRPARAPPWPPSAWRWPSPSVWSSWPPPRRPRRARPTCPTGSCCSGSATHPTPILVPLRSDEP